MRTQGTPFRQNRLANLLIEASPVAIVLTDSMGGIEVVNHVTEQWFGYSESELVGSSMIKIFHSDVDSDIASQSSCDLSQMSNRETGGSENLAPENLGPEELSPRKLWGRAKSGVIFPIEMSLHKLLLNNGERLLVNVVRLPQDDVDYEKRIQGERLAAVLQMISGLAHESGNALQRAQACLDLLELEVDHQSDLLELTERIRHALTDLHRNYQEVKSYASPIKLKLARVDFAELCQEVFDEIVGESREPIPKLRIQSSVCGNDVQVDRDQMAQVFGNVLQNAIQASPAESEICFGCRSIHDSATGNAAVEISIRDQGAGLSDEVAQHLFEPFFTTKQKGTGLGLPICRRIIQAHGGTIEAENDSDGGVEVRITLPIEKSTTNGK